MSAFAIRGEAILDVVIGLLEREGYEAVQVRRVAAEASISLTTLYKHFGNRDDLIIHAVQRWMEENVYSHLGEVPVNGSSLEAFSAIVHAVFEPWERQPNMLGAFIRARMGPGGAVLSTLGMGVVQPVADKFLETMTPDLLDDLILIVDHVLLATLARVAAGEIQATDIVPILDRTLARVMGGPLPPRRGRKPSSPSVLAPLQRNEKRK